MNPRRDNSSSDAEKWENYFPGLCTQVSSLGKELCSNNNSRSLAFPSALILEHLERFVVHLMMHNHSTGFQAANRDIVLNAFLGTGMHHKTLLDVYVELMNKNKHSNDMVLDNLQLCWSSATLLQQWIDVYESRDNSTVAKVIRSDFRAFFNSGMHALLHENHVFSRMLEIETSPSGSHAIHRLMQSTKEKVNETKQRVKNLVL